MNNQTFLVTRPNHDITTNYLYFWSEIVLEEASRQKIKILDLAGKKASKSNFVSYISKHRPSFIMINGHGSGNSVHGYGDETLVAVGDSEELLVNSVIYSRTCASALNLGKKVATKGSTAFIGYIYEFAFAHTSNMYTKPLQDNMAKLFLRPSNLVATTLLKGHTAKEAHERGLKEMKKNLAYTLSSAAKPEERNASFWLYNNIIGQVLLGNINATV